MSLENLVWAEKWRPTSVDECILPPAITKMIKEQIKSGTVPNYLFNGAPGVGKTTVAYAIAAELEADVLFINASLDGNIDTLRNKITQFVSTVSFTNSRKVVLMDEFDYVTAQTQPAMRGFLDQFSDNAIFILTCNYPNRIIDPLKSRLTCIEFKFTKEEKQPAALQMLKRVCMILENERIEYDKKSVAGLITRNFPDFRRTLVELQRYSSSGVIDSGILSNTDETGLNDLVLSLKEKNFAKCRQWVANSSMDSSQFYRLFYDKISPLLMSASVPQMILLAADYGFKASHSVDQEINQTAFLVSFMTSCTFK